MFHVFDKQTGFVDCQDVHKRWLSVDNLKAALTQSVISLFLDAILVVLLGVQCFYTSRTHWGGEEAVINHTMEILTCFQSTTTQRQPASQAKSHLRA